MGDLRFIVETYTIYCPDCGDERDAQIVRMPGTRYASVVVCAKCRKRQRDLRDEARANKVRQAI